MGISGTVTGVGGWTVGPIVGRRPAGVARDAVHPGTGARAVMVIVDGRFTGRGLPDPETVARAAIVGSPSVMPMLDAGLLEDGTRWYVTPTSPGPVLDPAAGCSPRRAATIAEGVARALTAVHGAGLVHGLVGPQTVIPAAGRHAERPVGTTLLLDTGVAALLGDRADELASSSGVSLPADRGAAADVHALGALLLRMLTAAAPAGPALAALPADLRALLSAMLDEHPSRRPTADGVARHLAGLREDLLATGPVEVQAPAGQRMQSAPIPVRRIATAPVGVAPAPVPRVAPQTPPPAPRPVPTIAAAPRQEVVARPVVPAPVPAPHTFESPIQAPRSGPESAPSLWTGSIPVAPAWRGASVVRRPRRGRRILLLAGGVGLAGLLVGVVSHLPLGHVDGDQAVAAVAEHGAIAPSQSAAGSSSAVTSATRAKGKHAAGTTSLVSAAAAAPAFIRPTALVPSPLAAAATSTTPSRNTSSGAGSTGSTSSTPVSSAPSSTTPGSTSSSSPASASVGSSDPSSPAGTTSDPGTSSTTPSDSSSPTDPAPTTDPATQDPAPSESTPTDPSTTAPTSPDPSSSDSTGTPAAAASS